MDTTILKLKNQNFWKVPKVLIKCCYKTLGTCVVVIIISSDPCEYPSFCEYQVKICGASVSSLLGVKYHDLRILGYVCVCSSMCVWRVCVCIWKKKGLYSHWIFTAFTFKLHKTRMTTFICVELKKRQTYNDIDNKGYIFKLLYKHKLIVRTLYLIYSEIIRKNLKSMGQF